MVKMKCNISLLFFLFLLFFKLLSSCPNEQTPYLTLSSSARFSATPFCEQHQNEHPPARLPACPSTRQTSRVPTQEAVQIAESSQINNVEEHTTQSHVFFPPWTKKYHWVVCCIELTESLKGRSSDPCPV